MSANAGAAIPSASVISRSFLITQTSPPEFLRLGNGKLTFHHEIVHGEVVKVSWIRDCHHSSSH